MTKTLHICFQLHQYCAEYSLCVYLSKKYIDGKLFKVDRKVRHATKDFYSWKFDVYQFLLSPGNTVQDIAYEVSGAKIRQALPRPESLYNAKTLCSLSCMYKVQAYDVNKRWSTDLVVSVLSVLLLENWCTHIVMYMYCIVEVLNYM